MYADYAAAIADYKAQAEQLYAVYTVEVRNYREDVTAIRDAALAEYKEEAAQIYDAAVAEYNAKVQTAVQEASALYDRIKTNFSQDWKLGSIDLSAETGDIIVPPAGIRGKQVSLTAKNLVLEGGEVKGNVQFDIDQIIGDLGDIAGPIGGTVGGDVVVSIDLPEIALPTLPEISLPDLPEATLPTTPTVAIPSTPAISVPAVPAPSAGGTSGLGGLSGSMGSLSTSNVSAATVAVASVQEEVIQQAKAETVSTAEEIEGGGDSQDKKRKGRPGLRLKRGVTIQVDVQEN
jgi:hypothetical protein